MSVKGCVGVPPFEDKDTKNDTKELIVTEYNTIKGKNFDEMTLDDFFKMLSKNKDCDDYDLKYDNKNKQFIVTCDDIKYSFKLDTISMANYELGNYNSITIQINKLINYFDNKNKETEIINKGNEGKKLTTKKEKKIYINYLKQCNKMNVLYTFINIGILLIVIAIFITSFILARGNIDYLALAYIIDTSLLAIYIISSPSGLGILDIINFLKDIKLNKNKIKQLEKRLTLENTKSINREQFDKSLENPVKEDLNEFTNAIMKEFGKLLNRINYINPNNKNKLLVKIQTLMDEYIDRYRNIVYSKKDGTLSLKTDDLEKLKLDITKKISEIESEMVNIREKDIDIKQILKEKALLDAKIKDSYEETNEEEKSFTIRR